MTGRLRETLARVAVPGAALWPRSVAGIIAAAWSVGMSLLTFAAFVLLGWILAPLGVGEFADTMRAASGIWQLAQVGAVQWQGATFSLPPLGLTLIVLLYQRRAGAWLARAVDAADAKAAASSLAFAVLAVASLTAIVANATATATLQPHVLRNACSAGLVSLAGFVWGIVRETGRPLRTPLDDVLPSVTRLVTGLAAASLLLIAALLVLQRGAFGAVLRAIAGDATSRTEVLLACLVYLPTLVVWVMAVLLGPGFALGAGTHIGVNGITLGALPPIPVFALIPAQVPRPGLLVWLVPLAVAWWAVSGLGRSASGALERPALGRLLAGTAGAFGLLGFLAHGGFGPGRLAAIGTEWWMPAAAAAGWVLCAALLSELLRVGLERIRR